MSDDLYRLRETAARIRRSYVDHQAADQLANAADTIAELRDENERLRAERDEAGGYISELWHAAHYHLMNLIAENGAIDESAVAPANEEE